MTIQQLEYIVALDTYRHFVTAAERCFVTQPTITIQVKKLEEEIGTLIFDRSKSPIVPTPMGEIILAKARSIIQEVRQLKSIIDQERHSLEGSFKIGIIATISPYIVPRFIGRFIQSHPNTHLDIDEMQSEPILDALNKGKLDMGILVTPVDDPFIREIPLFHEPFVYYGPENSPLKGQQRITPQDVEDLDGLWLLNSGHCFRNQVLNICNPSEKHKNIAFKSGSIETLKKMVDNYGGFTLIPEMAVNPGDKSRVLHFANPKPVREVSIVVHKSFAKIGLIEALRQEILQVVPSDFVKNQAFVKVLWK